MFESMMNFFKRFGKNEKESSKVAAKERLHLVLAQDRANISADFLEMMKQEIIEVIKKYIDIDEEAIDVRMTNKPGEDGTIGAPALYANIPIVTIKNEARKLEGTEKKAETKKEAPKNKSENENEKIEIEENSEAQKAGAEMKKIEDEIEKQEEKNIEKDEIKEQEKNDVSEGKDKIETSEEIKENENIENKAENSNQEKQDTNNKQKQTSNSKNKKGQKKK